MKKIILCICTLAILLIGIFSTNAQWVQTNGPYGGLINCFALSGTNLFAGTYNAGIFESTNNGNSWTAVNSGLSINNSINALAVNGTNIFAGTDNGIFLSTNNGVSWIAVDSGLTNTSVSCLVFSGSNLFAGTNGGGLFLSTILYAA